jgi:hypothetical protein
VHAQEVAGWEYVRPGSGTLQHCLWTSEKAVPANFGEYSFHALR